MSRLLQKVGSAVQVGEIASLLVTMKEQRARVCRRGWCSALGFFAIQYALSCKTATTQRFTRHQTRPTPQDTPASAGVFVSTFSACTGPASSSASSANTSRWRFTVLRPSNASATTRTFRCVSPLGLTVLRAPECPA